MITWTACVIVLLGSCERSVVRRAWRTAFTMLAIAVASTTMVFGGTVLRNLAASQSVKAFITNTVNRLPAEHPLYFYAGTDSEADRFSYKSFEYAAVFYASRPFVLLSQVDPPRAATSFFIATEQALAEHKRSPTSAAGELHLRELERFTYGDNPRRAPVLFVEASAP